jgi:hypothetical protein
VAPKKRAAKKSRSRDDVVVPTRFETHASHHSRLSPRDYSLVGSSLCTSLFLFKGEWILIPDGNADAAHHNAAGKASEV